MPSASVSTAASVNAGVRASILKANRKSVSIETSTQISTTEGTEETDDQSSFCTPDLCVLGVLRGGELQSTLSATDGSTRDARSAGAMLASPATTTSSTGAATNASGSRAGTSNSI